jgi:hypothetical protein
MSITRETEQGGLVDETLGNDDESEGADQGKEPDEYNGDNVSDNGK